VELALVSTLDYTDSGAGGVAQVVERLPSMRQALDSIPSMTIMTIIII
jgi:hypothetical protein